jgi:hypothetical protein
MAVGAAHTATNIFDFPRGWTYVRTSYYLLREREKGRNKKKGTSF